MIYFVQRQDSAIKIGTTVRLSQRLVAIEREHGSPVVVLGVLDGSYAEETALHQKFSAFRLDGEWFEPAIAVLDLIRAESRPWEAADDAPALVPVKIDRDVLAKVRIAAAYKGQSIAEYLSEIAEEAADRDIDERHAALRQQASPKPESTPKRKK